MAAAGAIVRASMLCGVLACGGGNAWAQTYPSKPIRIVVPFPPGGGTDLFARTMAQKLGAVFGQQIVVDNRSGAGGMIGAEIVAKAAPDGYTLLVTSSSSHSIAPHLTRKPLYDPIRDFAPVIVIASAPNMLVVHPSLPARTVRELIALAKAKPGAINYASNGSGTLSHLTGELFNLQAGTTMVHIPYKGGPPAVIDLMAGQVSVLFTAVPTALAQVRAGKLRALAVTGAKRVDALKELPTVAETLVGFESSQWWGMYAPPQTPAEIIDRLNAEATKIIVDPELRARFANEGAEPVGGSPKDMAAYLKADADKWGRVVKEAKVAPE
ncbi:MAG: Bug family tripartite tricarboxylate transporter substrate binding protein [Burkholderiales bacterium]